MGKALEVNAGLHVTVDLASTSLLLTPTKLGASIGNHGQHLPLGPGAPSHHRIPVAVLTFVETLHLPAHCITGLQAPALVATVKIIFAGKGACRVPFSVEVKTAVLVVAFYRSVLLAHTVVATLLPGVARVHQPHAVHALRRRLLLLRTSKGE